MITSNYLLRAALDGQEYIYEYDTPNMWSALEEFFHNDWQDDIAGQQGGEFFPFVLYSMENGRLLDCYPFTFNASVFHAFFDHGRTANGTYTLDQFDKDIQREPEAAVWIVSYVNFDGYDNNLYTKTNVFADEAKARKQFADDCRTALADARAEDVCESEDEWYAVEEDEGFDSYRVSRVSSCYYSQVQLIKKKLN